MKNFDTEYKVGLILCVVGLAAIIAGSFLWIVPLAIAGIVVLCVGLLLMDLWF